MKLKGSFMFVLTVLSFLMFFGCQKVRDDNAKIHDAIVAANKQFMDTFSKSDDAGMAALYTENAQLLPTNSDFVTGNADVQAFWKTVFDAGIKKAKLETVEVEGMGDTACEVGQYTLFVEGDQVADAGKYVVIWKKANGQWKLHRDIWNTSMPAQ